MKKIIAKLGFLVFVGLLMGACTTCTPEGGRVVDVVVLAGNTDCVLVGGASEKANKSALPGNHKPEAGLYKTPVRLSDPNSLPMPFHKALEEAEATPIKLITGRAYFIYDTAEHAEADSREGTVDNRAFAFQVRESGYLLLFGQRMGLFSTENTFPFDVKMQRKQGLSNTHEFLLKHKGITLLTLQATHAKPVSSRWSIMADRSQYTITQTGLKKDAYTMAPPIQIERPEAEDRLSWVKEGEVINLEDIMMVVTVTKNGVSHTANTPFENLKAKMVMIRKS